MHNKPIWQHGRGVGFVIRVKAVGRVECSGPLTFQVEGQWKSVLTVRKMFPQTAVIEIAVCECCVVGQLSRKLGSLLMLTEEKIRKCTRLSLEMQADVAKWRMTRGILQNIYSACYDSSVAFME